MADNVDLKAATEALNKASGDNNMGLKFTTKGDNAIARTTEHLKEPEAIATLTKEQYEHLNDPKNPLKGKDGITLEAVENTLGEAKAKGAAIGSALGNMFSHGMAPRANTSEVGKDDKDYTLSIKHVTNDTGKDFATDAPAIKLAMEGKYPEAKAAYDNAHSVAELKTEKLTFAKEADGTAVATLDATAAQNLGKAINMNNPEEVKKLFGSDRFEFNAKDHTLTLKGGPLTPEEQAVYKKNEKAIDSAISSGNAKMTQSMIDFAGGKAAQVAELEPKVQGDLPRVAAAQSQAKG